MSRLLALEEHVDGRRLEGQRAKLHGGRHVCRRGDRDVATSRRSRHFRVVPIPQTVRNVPKRSRWTPAAGTDEVDQNSAEVCRFSTFRHVSVLKTFISTHTHFRTLQSHTSCVSSAHHTAAGGRRTLHRPQTGCLRVPAECGRAGSSGAVRA